MPNKIVKDHRPWQVNMIYTYVGKDVNSYVKLAKRLIKMPKLFFLQFMR